ncbi:MAG: ADP-glyceromanno-heptose 6-epimerase [Ectothiorhodospiraceae bacterium]|nr:ADP-glyceromanno-heptose 6-epimerase [Chromatiales bacterium]MCP5156994.1 ADP-glyceromanno-heptose 6-epimerase [Ectothiorhodospiraceae bacterium]
MIVVTGGAGFIGSNLVRALNQRGETDICVVDDLSDVAKVANLADCVIADYLDRDDLAARIEAGIRGRLPRVRAVLHQGACSDTMETDGRFLMHNNYEHSRRILGWCLGARIPLVYASSAAVYGAGPVYRESPEHERPLNAYGYSKLAFDQHVRRALAVARSPVVGLRYFNVYGPREAHKGRMASVAWHGDRQLREAGRIRLFAGSDGYGDGEQRRDFVHVDDVVSVVLWFLEAGRPSGVFNVGTGRSQSFNELARAVVEWHGRGAIEYVPMPDALHGRYQSFTEADLDQLRAAGYDRPFLDVRAGVHRYLDAIHPER